MKSNKKGKQTNNLETSNSVIKKKTRISYKSSVCDKTLFQIENGYRGTVKKNCKSLFKNKEISHVPYKKKILGNKILQSSVNTGTRLNNKINGIKKCLDKKKSHDKEQEGKNEINDMKKRKLESTFSLKQLIVKIPQLEDKYHKGKIEGKILSKEKNNAREKDGLPKEYVCKCSLVPSVCKNNKINKKLQNNIEMIDNAKILPTNKNTCMKELIVKLTNILNISETSKQKKNEILFRIAGPKGTSEQYVNDMLKRPKPTEFYNLRHLQPKTYSEDSTINTSDSFLGCKHKIVNINTKKRNEIPIYQQVVHEKQIVNEEIDLYEFVDNSPKKNASKLNVSKSSIIFDKNMHDILRKIEQKEAKAKKKNVRKKINGFKCSIAPKKSYKNIIDTMVSDIKKNIKNNASKPVIKKTNNGNQQLSNKILSTLKSINNISEGHKHDTFNNSQRKIIPGIIHLNDFNHENVIAVHQSSEVPFSNKTAVSQQSNCINTSRNMDNANKFNCVKIGNNAIIHSNIVVSKEVPNINFSPPTDNGVLSWTDTSAIGIQNDVECCFGFDTDVPLLFTTKSVSHDSVNNINYLHGENNQFVESPVDFNIRRPNANSTMIHFRTINENSSPWRPNLRNLKQNPHFVSIKSNGLPRIDQEPVLDHTLVKKFERRSKKTSKNENKLTGKKLPTQQSILNFVEGNVETGNEYTEQNNFICELFNSPTKNIKECQKIVTFRKKNLENNRNIVSCTPVKRKILGDISNSSEEQVYVEPSMESNTLFGFNHVSFGINKSTLVEISTDCENRPKPSRFDLTLLKSYLVKDRKKKNVIIANKIVQAPNESVSLVQTSIEDKFDSNIHLFEEPEEILDSMSPPQLPKKSHRRKRLDSSDSDLRICELKRKPHKKTKNEIEQEEWINNFNQMCKEIEQHELEFN